MRWSNFKRIAAVAGFGLTLVLAGCSSSWTIDLSQADQVNSPVVTPAQLYSDWTAVQQGIDFKQVLVEQGDYEELLDIVRINPADAKISVHINEAEPVSVSTWQENLGATVVINGSYFDDAYELVTRTQATDQTAGPLLSGPTGFLYQVSDQWQIAETLPASTTQVVQSYPLLVDDGVAQVNTSTDDRAQRTVVATNAAGMVYFIVAEYGVLTMQELSAVLADLDTPKLTTALNLDGGSSTGLVISSDQLTYSDDSFIVPSVVAIR